MLQISTGKFYDSTDPDKLYVTTHRGVLYTNLEFFPDRVQTIVGDLTPAARWGQLGTLVCEIPERIPKPDQEQAGLLISVGPDTLIQDFAALVSFGMNVVCTPDENLATRLAIAKRPPLGIAGVPKDFVPRMFDEKIPFLQRDVDQMVVLIQNMMGLNRASYTGALRAVRQYVTAMYRMADDLNLAYTLLVASIESLVQEFDKFQPVWDDLDSTKREPIDQALDNAPDEVASEVRKAVLKSEHVALKRRFVAFALHHVPSSYYREEAIGKIAPPGRTALEQGLKSAYDLRSGYIHVLRPLPANLLRSPTLREVHLEGDKSLLTFAGLARVARCVIFEFVQRAPKVEKERYEYFKDYPNMITAQLAPQYWIHQVEGYSQKTARLYLNGFLSQYTEHLYVPSRPVVTDIRSVLKKIESLVPGTSKPEQRLPMLLLHYLFTRFLQGSEREAARAFMEPYLPLFDVPAVESLCAYALTTSQGPEWSLDTVDNKLKEYTTKRFQKNALNAGTLIGAAMHLWVAELHRAAGNDARARALISNAVEEYPDLVPLREFERQLPQGELQQILCWRILAPQAVVQSPTPKATKENATPRKSGCLSRMNRVLRTPLNLRRGARAPRK